MAAIAHKGKVVLVGGPVEFLHETVKDIAKRYPEYGKDLTVHDGIYFFGQKV